MNLGGVGVERQMHAARCAEVVENDRVIDDPRLENHRRLFYNELATPDIYIYIYIRTIQFAKWVMHIS